MSTVKKIAAFIIKDFKDEGTGENFTASTVPDIEAGAFANYKAAGLVRVPTAEEVKAKDKPSA